MSESALLRGYLILGVHVAEVKKDRRDLEGHFLFSGDERHVVHRNHFELVGPRVEFRAGAERQGGDLIDARGLQLRRSFHQGGHAGDIVAGDEFVSEQRMRQRGQTCRFAAKRFQEAPGFGALVLIRRLLENFDGPGVRCFLFLR